MKKRYRLETIASFFIVGSGQLIKGEGHKALKLILGFYFALPVAAYAALAINAHLFLLVLSLSLLAGIIIWGYNIWDAYTHETLD